MEGSSDPVSMALRVEQASRVQRLIVSAVQFMTQDPRPQDRRACARRRFAPRKAERYEFDRVVDLVA